MRHRQAYIYRTTNHYPVKHTLQAAAHSHILYKTKPQILMTLMTGVTSQSPKNFEQKNQQPRPLGCTSVSKVSKLYKFLRSSQGMHQADSALDSNLPAQMILEPSSLNRSLNSL